MSLISIVVPVYHNESSLPELLQRLQGVASKHAGHSFEFLFVDDGSRDNSFAVLCKLAEAEPRVRIVKLVRNFGSNSAILCGLEHAKGDAIGVIAADLQDPPELLSDLVTHWENGKKVALAARATRDDPWLTTLLADTFYWLFRSFALPNMPARGFDFFVIDRQVRDLVVQLPERNHYLMGMLVWVGFDPAIVYYHRQAREERFGSSMWTFSRKVRYFTDAFVAFSQFPLRLTTGVGMLLAFGGLCYAALVVTGRSLGWWGYDGWSSLMTVSLVVGGMQLIMLGVQGEYVGRLLEEARQRPRYLVEKEVGGESEASAKREAA
jgi:dolichol-phosphate mannosyltransferase